MSRTALGWCVAAAVAAAFAAGWLVRDVASPGSASSPQDSDTEGADGAAEERRDPSGAPREAHASASSQDRSPRSAASSAAPGGRSAMRETESRAAPAEPSFGRREGRADLPEPRTVDEFLETIRTSYDEAQPTGLRPTPDDLLVSARDARDRAERQIEAAGVARRTRAREQVGILQRLLELRTVRGLASDGPTVIELRSSDGRPVNGEDRPGQLQSRPFDPFDAANASIRGAGVLGGVPERGHVFVLERVEIEGRLGSRARDGRLAVSWPGESHVWSARTNRLRCAYVGEGLVPNLGALTLVADESTARVRFVGRVAPAGAPVAARPFAWDADAAEGFLRGGVAVRIQIVADHGGGNPRTVDLAGGTNGRFHETSDRPVWDETADLRKLTRSVAWTEGAGLVPDGSVFRVQRIEWRARLAPGDSHSTFDIRHDGAQAPLQEARPPEIPKERRTDAPASILTGTWSGDVEIRPGQERNLTFTCHMYGMADISVFGRVEPDGR